MAKSKEKSRHIIVARKVPMWAMCRQCSSKKPAAAERRRGGRRREGASLRTYMYPGDVGVRHSCRSLPTSNQRFISVKCTRGHVRDAPTFAEKVRSTIGKSIHATVFRPSDVFRLQIADTRRATCIVGEQKRTLE